MVVQIPRGREIKEESKEVFRERNGKIYAYPNKIEAFQKSAGTAPQDYALVQEGNQAKYAISMKQRFGGFQFVPANIEVLQSGLIVPTPAIFLPHYKNVNEAQQGRTVLYDASGNVIEGERLDNYTHTLNYDCWVWINAHFPKGKGFLGLDLAIITGLNKKGKPVIKKNPLEDCLGKDCFAELDSLNKQGFPTKEAKTQSFEAGKTVYFLYPRVDSAARFGADSYWAVFICSWYPRLSDDRLGVFDCAEGARKKSE